MPTSITWDQEADPLSFLHNYPLPCLFVRLWDYKILAANKAAGQLLQKAEAVLLQSAFLDYLAPADKQKVIEYLQSGSLDGAWPNEIYFQVDEAILMAEVYSYGFPYKDEPALLLTLIDRTSHYTQQQQLAVMAQRYTDFIKQSSEGIYLHEFSTPIPIYVSDAEFLQLLKRHSEISDCNDALARMYGYDKAEEMRGLSASHFVDFDDPLNVEYFKLFKRSGLRVMDSESKEVDRYGYPRYFLNNLVSVVEDGLLKRVWGTQRDITEKREIEKKVQLFSSLVEHTSDVLIALDKELNPLTWNGAAERVFGLTAKQVIGKSLKQYLDIHYQYATREEVMVTIHAKGEWRGEIKFRQPVSQKIVTLFAGYKALYDTKNELIGYLLSATDMSERIAVDKKMRLLASLVENTSDVLIAVDLDYQAISWNEAAERISGLNGEHVIGKDVRKILDIRYHSCETDEVKAVLMAKGSWKGEMCFVRPADGKKITLLCTYKLFKDDLGSDIGFIISGTDITERKKLESQLLIEKLMHQRQLTQATIDGQEKERREIGKDLHDNIGQQLTTTKLYLEMAGTSAGTLQQEMIDLAQQSVSKLINEVRQISRALVPSTLMDLGLIESVNDLVETMTRTQNMDVEVKQDAFDEQTLPDNLKLMLFRIVQEQLNNIVKHAQAGRVTISFAIEACSLYLTIIDDGVGFDPHKVHRGLGIANIKNRAELFGGQVEILAAPQKGCTLRVIIPLGATEDGTAS